MQSVKLNFFNKPEEAPHFVAPEFKGATLDHVNIVRKGTVEGHSTVDLIFVDQNGQKYIAMITGRLMNLIGKEAMNEFGGQG